MPISVTCPKGHQLNVPDSDAGTAVSCPWCSATVQVPGQAAGDNVAPAAAKPSAQPAAGVVMSPGMLLAAGCAWAASLLLAVYVGSTLTGNGVAENAQPIAANPDVLPPIPAPLVADEPADEPQVAVVEEEPEVAHEAPEEVKEARKDIKNTPLARNEEERMPLPVEPAAAVPTAKEAAPAKELLIADIKEAIEMIENNQQRLLIADFLPQEVAMGMQRQRSRPGRGDELIPKEAAEDLKAHLEAALTADITLNRNSTLAEVQYIREPVEVVPDTPLEEVPKFADRPKAAAPGLGKDLPKMLASAAKMLKSGDVETFIQNVYPLPELARLEQGDSMKRLQLRMASRPQMSAAMVRDLEAAAAADITIEKDQAEVKLPPLTEGDQGRLIKFQLIEGHWRFFDGGQQTRDEHRQLAAKPIPGHTIPGSRGVITFTRTGDNWRLFAMPVAQPLDE